jgi:nitrate reductase gamma subunit
MDLILFGVFPYVAVALALAVGLYRYCIDRYSWSSQSSQFLESRLLFWGSVPWHFAILLILLAHLLAFLFPAGWGVLLGRPLRLYLLEVSGMALGLATVVAVALLILRRATNDRVAAVTSVVDWVLLAGFWFHPAS